MGIGLVTDPKAIFLDEPTTGLDSENALKLMELLARLSRKGRTVSMPAWQLYDVGSSKTT